MADICQRVASQPAAGFHEALQVLWFAHVLLHINSSEWSISPGVSISTCGLITTGTLPRAD